MKQFLLFIFFGSICSANYLQAQKSNWVADSTYVESHLYDQPDSALTVCNDWLGKVERESKKYAFLLSRKAVIDDIQGRPDQAVKGYLSAIKIQKRLKDSVELSFSYNNLGISYFYMYRYDDAIENYRKSARIDSLNKDLKGWSGTMLNIAIIYSNQNKYEKAISIYDNILRLLNEINDHSLDGMIYSNSAKLFVLRKEYRKALSYVTKARTQIEAGNDPSPKMTLEVITSNAYMGLFQFDKALNAARRGISYDTGNDYPERRVHLYECLSHAFYAKAQIDSGNYYNDLYQQYRDSLFNRETQAQLSEIQTWFGVAEKNRELAESQLEKARYKNKSIRDAREASENKAQRNLFIALAAIFVIVGLLMFIVLQRRKAEKALLKESLQTKEQLVAQKEAFLGEIHHRVRNNLQMVSSMLAMQEVSLDSAQGKKALESSRSRIETMSLIHERLYKKSSGRAIQLNDYVRQLTEQILASYTDKQVQVSFDVGALYLHIDSVVPLALILNELITNSLKYAFPENETGEIFIRIEQEGSVLLLDYADSGKGFDIENGNGFGSRLIKSLSRQLKAERKQERRKDKFHQLFYIHQYKTAEK